MLSDTFRPLMILIATASVLALLPQSSAIAQRQVERYQPARPTISPYLDLFRQDSGVIDPFNSFIQPQRRLQSTARQFQREIAGQQTTIRQLEGEVQNQLQMRPTGARPTGTGATFMNYSHFFPGGGGRAGRR